MRDRQPTPGMEGRVLITPEDTSIAPFHARIAMADDALEEGTPLIKATLLSDEAEVSLFDAANDRSVSDAFYGIGAKIRLIMKNNASITVTVKDQAGNAVKNVLVDGIYTEAGGAVYTGSDGVASGLIAEGTSTISIKNYADLEDVSKTLTVVKGSTITETLTPTRRNFLKLIESQNVKFSGNATTADVTSVGGGGASGRAYSVTREFGGATGGSGAGGHCTVSAGIAVEANTLYPAIVGAGADVGSDRGGTTSFLGVVAEGGYSGTDATSKTSPGAGRDGNGNGVNGIVGSTTVNDAVLGKSGIAGTVDGYASFTTTTKYGGSGASGGWNSNSPSIGGGYGGNSGSSGHVGGVQGTDGYGGGAGSGSGFNYEDDGETWSDCGSAARGGHGCVAMRIHFDFGDLIA